MFTTIQTPVRLEAVSDGLAIHSPYNPAFVAALKAKIPATDRMWDGRRKVWIVSQNHGKALQNLIASYYGQDVKLPKAHSSTAGNEMRLLDVRYIGAAKDRGDGAPTSFAWSGGKWSVIIPKSVLMEWFGQTQQPGEAQTLYGVLGVSQSVDPAELKTSWRRLVRQWHPDVCKEPNAREQFDAIQAAYQVLGDVNQRAKYDAGLAFEAMAKAHSDSQVVSARVIEDWRPPLRCGLILVEGQERLGRFIVNRILQWADIVNANGDVLVTSWVTGNDQYTESWVQP